MVVDNCKLCSQCKQNLSVDLFYKVNRKTGDGYSGYCKTCTSDRALAWQKDNPAADRAIRERRNKKVSETRHLLTEEQKQKLRDNQQRCYWGPNYERQKERQRRWKAEQRIKDPETARANAGIQCGRRRCRLKGRQSDLKLADWKLVLAAFDRKCAVCGCAAKYLDMDHVIPIQLGGNNVVGNVVPMCRPCNGQKSQRDPLEFAKLVDWDIVAALHKARVRNSDIPICVNYDLSWFLSVV